MSHRHLLLALILGGVLAATTTPTLAAGEPSAPSAPSMPPAAPEPASSALTAPPAVAAASAAVAAPAPAPAPAPTPDPDALRVTDPYLEFHSGAGRGYPVVFVAARGESVTIELRHTDWYRVRAPGGQVGWVHRSQLATTLADNGQPVAWRDVLLDDYLRRKLEFGGSAGRFQREPALRLWAGYRLADTLRLEGAIHQVQGVFSGTSLRQLDLLVDPWFDRRLSPFFGVGLGHFSNVPNKSLVENQHTSASAAHVTAGIRYYLSDRFVLRADYSLYSVFLSDTQSAEYRSFMAGVSFFF